MFSVKPNKNYAVIQNETVVAVFHGVEILKAIEDYNNRGIRFFVRELF